MKNIYDVLKERGFVKQVTNEDKVREMLGTKGVKFYIGFDATADSLTAGHFLTVMVMMHLQQAGHIPIALLGGGTTLIGDPSARSDMRKMMSIETINHNAQCFKKQLSKFIDFNNDKAYIANNADWLLDLNYVDFIRDIGVHFNVKHMLQAECYKQRVDKGLTLFEFNYMLMQSYDFLKLYKDYGCLLEVGGNDQWSNIIGGVDLIRLKEKKEAHGMTFTLLANSDGVKMGKSMKGALWLDKNKTSPFEFFQYWRNVEDVKVEECLGLLTFLPMDQVRELGKLNGSEINKAKEILAYEVTKLVHGEEEAVKALEASKKLFLGGGISDNAPTKFINKDELKEGLDILNLLLDIGLENSKGDARRTINQGGLSINGEKLTDIYKKITIDDFIKNTVLIKKGKKKFYQLKLEGEV